MAKNPKALKKKRDPAEMPPRLSQGEAEARRQQALSVVQDHTIGSLAPAAIPFPVFDLVALTGIQLKMLNSLCSLYGLTFSNKAARVAVTSLLSKMLSTSFTPMLASFIKVIPGVGQASGVAGMMATGGASTYAVGKLFIRHFEAGGNLSNFNAKAMSGYLRQEFEQGKKVSNDLAAKDNHLP